MRDLFWFLLACGLVIAWFASESRYRAVRVRESELNDHRLKYLREVATDQVGVLSSRIEVLEARLKAGAVPVEQVPNELAELRRELERAASDGPVSER